MQRNSALLEVICICTFRIRLRVPDGSFWRLPSDQVGGVASVVDDPACSFEHQPLQLPAFQTDMSTVGSGIEETVLAPILQKHLEMFHWATACSMRRVKLHHTFHHHTTSVSLFRRLDILGLATSHACP